MDIAALKKMPGSMWRDVTAPQEAGNGQNPADNPGAGSTGPAEKQGDNGLKGAVSEATAQAGAKHTKIPVVSLSEGAKGAGSPNTGSAGTGAAGGTTQGTGGNTVTLGELIEGKAAVDLIDALLPALLVVGLYAIGMEIRKSDIQLTDREKGILAPYWQKCLDSIHINFDNPWVAMAVAMGAIYGGKVIEKGGKEWIDKIGEKKAAKMAAKKAAAEAKAAGLPTEPSEPSMEDINASISGNNGFTEDAINKVRKTKKLSRDNAIRYLQGLQKKKDAA